MGGRLSSGEPPREARKTKTREFSVNWMYYDDKKLEIVDGTKGCPLDSSDEQIIVSRVAPHSLYQQFKKIAPNFNIRIKSSYDETKKSATDYLIAKNILIKDFSKNGFGKWMHKPEETSGFDSFSLIFYLSLVCFYLGFFRFIKTLEIPFI